MNTASIRLAPNIHLQEFDSASNAQIYIAQLPNGKKLQLTTQLYMLLRCLQEPKSISTWLRDFQSQSNKRITEAQINQLLKSSLIPAGLVTITQTYDLNLNQTNEQEKYSRKQTRTPGLWFARELILPKYLEPLTQKLGFLFHPIIVTMILIGIFVTHLFVYRELGFPPILTPQNPPGPFVFVLIFFSVIFHELGHLAACKYWGISHGSLGFGFYWTLPVLYADVSNSWILSRRKRAVVDIAGVYFQLVFSLFLVGASRLVPHPVYLWAVVYIDFIILLNLNPFFKFDGYWLISDLSGIANLHKRASELLYYYTSKRLHIKRFPATLSPFVESFSSKIRGAILAYGILSLIIMTTLFIWIMSSIPDLTVQLLFFLGLATIPLESALAARDFHLFFQELGHAFGHLFTPITILFGATLLINRLLTYLLQQVSRQTKQAAKIISYALTICLIGSYIAYLQPQYIPTNGQIVLGGLSLGEAAPLFTTSTIKGTPIHLKDYAGQSVLLHFWSPECPTCVAEIPAVRENYQQLQGEVAFLTIAISTTQHDLDDFIKKHAIDYPVLLDEQGHIAHLYQISSVPRSYMIDIAGKIESTAASMLIDEDLHQLPTQDSDHNEECESSCTVVP